MYLFPFLHQATTPICTYLFSACCISSLFYIKPQLIVWGHRGRACCISSLFYIKPQLVNSYLQLLSCCISSLFYIKPQHSPRDIIRKGGCISSLFYIKPQRPDYHLQSRPRCISSLFYIKPQPAPNVSLYRCVVSLPFSTSSHNFCPFCMYRYLLYLFPFLHQATTVLKADTLHDGLYLFPFLHQATT